MAGGGGEETAIKRRKKGNLVRQADQPSIDAQTRPEGRADSIAGGTEFRIQD